jgi:hypothetical protein
LQFHQGGPPSATCPLAQPSPRKYPPMESFRHDENLTPRHGNVASRTTYDADILTVPGESSGNDKGMSSDFEFVSVVPTADGRAKPNRAALVRKNAASINGGTTSLRKQRFQLERLRWRVPLPMIALSF